MITLRSILFSNALLFNGSGTAPKRGDLLLRGRKIIASGEIGLQLPADTIRVPADELCISPGWIDLHTHIFAGQGVFSIEPEEAGLSCGVTTLVDAGSAGPLNLSSLLRGIGFPKKESVVAYVNVASGGILHGHAGEPGFIPDHYSPQLHSLELACRVYEEHYDTIVGWKARLTAALAGHRPECEWSAWNHLLKLRSTTGLPLMVHHIESCVPLGGLLKEMTARDVYTHLYHGRPGGPFDPETGAPLPPTLHARERGVLFDVGHGSGAFQWSAAERACTEYNFWPDTISTDVHRYNLFWPVRDLATTMSKFLQLGASPEAIVAMVTANAAKAIGRTATLEPGAPATLTLFQIENGEFSLEDIHGSVRIARQRFLPIATLQNGSPTPCHGLLSHMEMPLGRHLQQIAAL